MLEAKAAAYWRATVRLLAITLAIWFVVSFGAAILFADALNEFSLGGYKLASGSPSKAPSMFSSC
jgi:uncharacterized membrane protein